MNIVYEETKKSLMHDSQACVVNVMSVEGSSPAVKGSKMLVRPNGKIVGTVGGGELEKSCMETAVLLYKSKQSFKKIFNLDSSEEVNMICGGKVEIEFRYFENSSGLEEYFEIEKKQPRCIIFGAGHVGKEVFKLAEYAGFETLIFDDRKDFASDGCVLCDYSKINKFVTFEKDDYIVIMTHGHIADREVLLQVCKTEARYIGCIGSRKKVVATQEYLAENGIPEERIKSIHSPIGLDIGGDTPQEIAISVIAEMIQHKYSEEK